MADMVEVVIDSIRVSLMSQQRLVILREANADRYLVIWIGQYEAEAITMAMQGVEVARPLTWDLLKNIFGNLNARIVRVEVVELRDDTYFGSIVVEANGSTLEIDSRPSDALALAVRAHVPIYVARSVMQAAGITPEDDLQQKAAQLPAAPLVSRPADAPADVPAGSEGTEEGEDRLSIFEDFLDQLNKGDKEDDADADNEEKKD
jgi:bifunctional DNase/RNase